MTLKSSGYLAAESTVAWTSGQSLNSATDNEWTDLSDEISNTTNLYIMVDVEIVLASAAFTGTDSSIALYVVPSLDGTNYPNWTGNVTTDEQENEQYYARAGTTSGATAAQRMVISRVVIPPGVFKFGLRNMANVTLAASGNTVKYRAHSYQDV